MAGTKISQLPVQSAMATDDQLVVVDTGDSETRRITASALSLAMVRYGLSTGTSAPTSPATGQLWVDTNTNPPLLKVWTSAAWSIVSIQAASVITSPGSSAPSNPTTGVLWLDTSATPVQLKAWDGSNWTQIDPDAINRTASTGSAILPVGTTAQRDGVPAAGYLRYNSTLSQFEGYNGSAWGAVGGGATGGAGSYAFYENDITITASYTITTNKNAMTAGPVVVNAGVTITVPSGSTWTVV